jgi:tetratricopeptide (TPR) repeat protein
LVALADLERGVGNYTDAMSNCKLAVAIDTALFRDGHPAIARDLNVLAETYAAQEQYAEAEPLFQRALAARKQLLGPAHPVSIAAVPFSGSFRGNLTTYEFAKLRGQLAEAVERLSGRWTFESTESDIVLAVEFSPRGTATVSGLLRPNGSERTTLSFNFETDQTMLSETVRQLGELVVRLPVREAQ